MLWRERIAEVTFSIMREYLPQDDDDLKDLARHIAECVPSPDERNGFAVVPAESTEAMMAAAKDDLASVDGLLSIAAAVARLQVDGKSC